MRQAWAVDLWSRAREPMDNLMDGKLPPSRGCPQARRLGAAPQGPQPRRLPRISFSGWSRANERRGTSRMPEQQSKSNAMRPDPDWNVGQTSYPSYPVSSETHLEA